MLIDSLIIYNLFRLIILIIMEIKHGWSIMCQIIAWPCAVIRAIRPQQRLMTTVRFLCIYYSNTVKQYWQKRLVLAIVKPWRKLSNKPAGLPPDLPIWTTTRWLKISKSWPKIASTFELKGLGYNRFVSLTSILFVLCCIRLRLWWRVERAE